jgi:hypothetical protein
MIQLIVLLIRLSKPRLGSRTPSHDMGSLIEPLTLPLWLTVRTLFYMLTAKIINFHEES